MQPRLGLVALHLHPHFAEDATRKSGLIVYGSSELPESEAFICRHKQNSPRLEKFRKESTGLADLWRAKEKPEKHTKGTKKEPLTSSTFLTVLMFGLPTSFFSFSYSSSVIIPFVLSLLFSFDLLSTLVIAFSPHFHHHHQLSFLWRFVLR